MRRALAAFVLAAGMVVVPAPFAHSVACADVIRFRTLNLDVHPITKVVKVGGVAKVAVEVTRPAHEDPLQQGVTFDPPVSEPAADVTVGIGLHIGPVFAPGYAKTPASGKAVVSIRIPTYASAHPVNLDGYAYRVIGESPCYTLLEDGYTRLNNALKVT